MLRVGNVVCPCCSLLRTLDSHLFGCLMHANHKQPRRPITVQCTWKASQPSASLTLAANTGNSGRAACMQAAVAKITGRRCEEDQKKVKRTRGPTVCDLQPVTQKARYLGVNIQIQVLGQRTSRKCKAAAKGTQNHRKHTQAEASSRALAVLCSTWRMRVRQKSGAQHMQEPCPCKQPLAMDPGRQPSQKDQQGEAGS
jgi:hypothetical protein